MAFLDFFETYKKNPEVFQSPIFIKTTFSFYKQNLVFGQDPIRGYFLISLRFEKTKQKNARL